jgi:peptide chain release factor subunit 1
MPPTGVVVLGSAQTGTMVLGPPKPVAATLYTCDNKYRLDALRDLLDSCRDPALGLIITDGSVCRGYTLTCVADAKRMFDITSQAAGRTRRGGSSAARIGRIREDQENCFHKRIADSAARTWLDSDGRPAIQSLVVAGPAGSKAAVADCLCGALKTVLLPLVTTATTDVETTWQLSADARAWAGNALVRSLQQRVNTLRDTDPDLLVWGAEEILAAARARVLEIALVYSSDVYDPREISKQMLIPCLAVSMDVGILRYHCGEIRDLGV